MDGSKVTVPPKVEGQQVMDGLDDGTTILLLLRLLKMK